MKTLLVILAILFCLQTNAQKRKRVQIPNLEYTMEFEAEKGKELNFYAEYANPFKETSFSSPFYVTKEAEFIFKDESYHTINPSTNQVEEVYGDTPYVLTKLFDRSKGVPIDVIELSEKGNIHPGKERKMDVFEYRLINYDLRKIFFKGDWWFITPISSGVYENLMRVNCSRRNLFIFIKEKSSKINLEDGGTLSLVAPQEIYVLKEKQLINAADEPLNF